MSSLDEAKLTELFTGWVKKSKIYNDFSNDDEQKKFMNVIEFLMKGYKLGNLGERVKGKYFLVNNDVVAGEVTPTGVLYIFVLIGLNARELVNNNTLSSNDVEYFRSKLNFYTNVIDKFSIDAMNSLQGGANRPLSAFVLYGYQTPKYDHVIKYIKDSLGDSDLKLSLKPDTTLPLPQKPPTEELRIPQEQPTANLIQLPTSSPIRPSAPPMLQQFIPQQTQSAPVFPKPSAPPMSPQSIPQHAQSAPVQTTAPPMKMDESVYPQSPFTQSLPDSDLLLYDFPAKRVIKYNPKTQQYEASEYGVPVGFAGKSEDCYGTGYNDCDDFDTILTDTKLLEKLKNGQFDFNSIVAKKINQMNPQLAMDILKSFGFEQVGQMGGFDKIENYSKESSLRYQTVEEWISGLETKGVNKDIISKIRSNNLALTYLRALVEYVNGINKISGAYSTQATSKYLQSIGVSRLPPIKFVESKRDMDSSLLQLANVMRQKHQLASRPFIYPQFAIQQLRGGQNGGEKGAKLRSIILGLIRDLESRGKRLSDKDKVALMSNLDMLDTLETNLEQVRQNLSQYKGWTDAIPDRTQEEVSVGSMGHKLEKYKNCVRQQQNIENGLIEAAKRINDCLTK